VAPQPFRHVALLTGVHADTQAARKFSGWRAAPAPVVPSAGCAPSGWRVCWRARPFPPDRGAGGGGRAGYEHPESGAPAIAGVAKYGLAAPPAPPPLPEYGDVGDHRVAV